MPLNKTTKIISVVNQKGGVGKTTTVMNIGAIFAALENRVLIIDMDPQSNTSSGIGLTLGENEKSVYDVLVSEESVENTVKETQIPGLFLLPAVVDLAGAEVELVDLENREFKLKKALEKAKKENLYDYILIDCPPSLGLLTINALCASDSILIPLQCEFFALEGLTHLLGTLERVKENLNKFLKIEGIVLTMYDKRNRLTEQVENDVRDCLGKMVYETVIPRNVKLSEAPSHGLPVTLYDSNCIGSIAYMNLAKEFIKRNSEENNNEK